MKRFQWAVAVPLLVLAPYAQADSPPTYDITHATVVVRAGSDNVGFTFTGPGTDISGSGGIACQETWCDGQVFPSGSVVIVELGQIFIDSFDTAKIGGHDTDPNTLGLTGLALDTSGDLVFSGTSGGTFCQGAALSTPVSGTANSGDTFTDFMLKMPAGEFCTNWFYSVDQGGFIYDGGKFVADTAAVPEPGTLGLMVLGVAGMFGMVRTSRRDYRRSPK